MKMLKNGRTDGKGNLHHAGCSCCNTKRARRAASKSLKRAEERAWKSDTTNNPGGTA